MRTKGNAIAQYGIIIALVALALVPVFYLFGKNIVDYFANFKNMLGGNNTNVVEQPVSTTPEAMPPAPVATAAIKAGELGGTPDQPQLVCKNGICAIDYGDFVLNGIPENFNDFVLSSGTSGGTTTITDLLMQLAQQYKDNGKLEESEIIKKLAITGHNIAAIQKYSEKMINSCNKDIQCLKNLTDKNDNYLSSIEGFDDTYYEFPAHLVYYEINDAANFTLKNVSERVNTTDFQDKLNDGRLEYIFLDQFNNIQQSNGIDDATKDLITELSWVIGVMGKEFENNTEMIYNPEHPPNQGYNDPLTGEYIEREYMGDDTQINLSMFENYTASRITNLNSMLICVTGQNIDTGEKCH